ncbi:MAG: family 10 glycosylhydrolase [Deltaproteobacteria bacterium]|nr:family 10 glycosylhydrolase [Deltaproteobacteria bacterium]
MNRKRIIFFVMASIFIASLSCTFFCYGRELVVDPFDSAMDAEPQAAWQAEGNSLPVSIQEGGPWGSEKLTVFPLNFSDPSQIKCSWYKEVELGFSSSDTFVLRFYSPNPLPINEISLYLHNADSNRWHDASIREKHDFKAGWNTLIFHKKDFHADNTLAGRDQIDRIRFCAWRKSEEDTTLFLDKLHAVQSPVYIILESIPRKYNSVERICRFLTRWLNAYDIPTATITEEQVETGMLDGAELAIMPYQYESTVSDLEYQKIEDFVNAGGKLLMFYQMDPRIAELLGVEIGASNDTDIGAIHFLSGNIAGFLPRILSHSKKFLEVQPSHPDTDIIGYLEDSDGNLTSYPAWLSGENGAYFSAPIHGFHWKDSLGIQNMLLALIAHHVPSLQKTIGDATLANMGDVALYESFDQAYGEINDMGPLSLNPEDVAATLTVAQQARQEAEALYAGNKYPEMLSFAFKARKALVHAYALCQHPRSNEFRGLWVKLWPGEWRQSAQVVHDAGFNAIFPRMLTGGIAHYPSEVLPRSDTYEQYGDQIAQCLLAYRPLNIEIHIWKNNWVLDGAPESFIDEMRAQGRIQIDVYGNEINWLCPSHPLNVQLELDSLMEIVRGYDIDGIHLDTIRYPSSAACYCNGCRLRFETFLGRAVHNWPEDCYDGWLKDTYRDWRAMQITHLVKEVHRSVKALKPKVKISAAVVRYYPESREDMGQDWVDWIKQGYLDFIVPMDYTEHHDSFSLLVEQQLQQSEQLIPVYPGIGIVSSGTNLSLDNLIVQIRETRKQQTGGFVGFTYHDYAVARGIFPLLSRGTTFPRYRLNFGFTSISGNSVTAALEDGTLISSGSLLDKGTSVILTAAADHGYRFNGWAGDVPSGQENVNPLAIVMDADKTIQANFMRQYHLGIETGPGGRRPRPGLYTYDAGAVVFLKALSKAGYGFVGWTGSVPLGHELDNPLKITMGSDKSVKANFKEGAVMLTVSLGRGNGSTDANYGGTTDPDPGKYICQRGDKVEILAVPKRGFRFHYWKGVSERQVKENPLGIEIDSDKAITAYFGKANKKSVKALKTTRRR